MVGVLGNTYNNLLIPRKFTRYVLSPSQLRTGFSAPTIIIPGIPSTLILIKQAFFKRETGTAYTLNGATLNGLCYGTSPTIGRTAIIPTTLLSSGANNLRIIYGPQSTSGTAGSILTDIVANDGGAELGQPISWFNNVANYTGGSGRLGILITYYEVDFGESNFGI
jgi:hypothetical protein